MHFDRLDKSRNSLKSSSVELQVKFDRHSKLTLTTSSATVVEENPSSLAGYLTNGVEAILVLATGFQSMNSIVIQWLTKKHSIGSNHILCRRG